MALNIPLPDLPGTGFLKGVDTGSSMFARLIQPVIERQKMAQQAEQFKQEIALRKAAAARAGANSDLSRKILQEQLLGLQHKNDPMYEFNQYKALENMIKGGGMTGNAMQAAPNQEFGEGMGVLSPEGLSEMTPSNSTASAPNAGGLDIEVLKQHPMLRAFAKKHLGYDPLEAIPQTPEEKNQAAIDLFKQKEAIKASGKATGATALTNPIKTKYQSVIGGARSALPIIDKLIAQTRKGEIPGQMFGSMFKRDAQANYMGEVSTLLDGIRNAYTIPNTDSGTAKAEDKVLRKRGESDDNYIKRLQTIRAQIVDREADARTKLSSGNITTQSEPTDYSSMSDEELRRIAGGG